MREAVNASQISITHTIAMNQCSTQIWPRWKFWVKHRFTLHRLTQIRQIAKVQYNANLADKQRVITKASIKSTQVMVDGRRQVNNS